MIKKATRSRASKAIINVTNERKRHGGLARRASAKLERAAARQTQGTDPRMALYMIPMPQVIAGIRLTDQEAMCLSVVWACIDAIVKAVVCSDWKVYAVQHLARSNRVERIEQPDDPIAWILNKRPNSEATAIAWKEAMYYSAVGTGNGYSEIVRNGSGKVTELHWLETNRVLPRREVLEDGKLGGIVYDVWQYQGGWVTLQPNEMFHLRGPSLDSLTGDHMLARAAHTIANAVAAERFRGNYFANNTVMGTILKHPRTLSDTAHKRLVKDYEDKHKGPHKAHKPLILEGGMDIVTSIGTDPQKSQMIETSQFEVEDICRFFGVPPHKVQHLLRATNNNIEHLGIEFTRDAVTPWTKRGEQEADYKLFPQKAPWRETKMDTAWLMFGDAKSQAEAYQIYRRTGVYSVNDILSKRGENTIGPEGDVRMVENNMMSLEALGATARKMIAEADKAEKDATAPTAPPPQKPGTPPDAAGASLDTAVVAEDVKATTSDVAAPRAALREAVQTMIVGSLERYSRRLANRAADLHRGKRDEVAIAVHMAEERAALRPRLAEECGEALQIAARAQPGITLSDIEQTVANAADLVDNGSAAAPAAELIVRRYMGEA